MSETIKASLKEFFQRARATRQKIQAVEEDWLSPCLAQDNSGRWQPVWRQVEFSNIEQALELTLHPDIQAFYGSCLAPSIQAHFKQLSVTLLQSWNDEDFALLQENIIGHLMMKKRLRQQASIFIAALEDDTQLVSVLNATGEVVLEPVGKEPIQVLAPSIAEFIDQLVVAE